MKNTTTLTNSFHNTEIEIRASVGEIVSRSTLRRAQKRLCGIEGCTCGREDGTRDSRYQLESRGFGKDAEIVVIDSQPRPLRTQVVARYEGEVIGYFDNADDAQAAIDAREARESDAE